MRLIQTVPLAAGILLAACSGDADTNEDGMVSSEEVVAEAGDAITQQPGEYRATYEMLEFEVPGAPAELQQQLESQMGSGAAMSRTLTYCLTPEQAESDGPEQMAKNMAEGDCTVAKFDVSGGSLSADMTCKGANGASSHVVMQGEMTTNSSTMTMTSESEMPGMGKVQSKMRVSAERIGDCPA